MITSCRQLLVHLDGTRACANRLAIARKVAAGQGAALAALYASTPTFLEIPYAPELGPMLAAELVEIDDRRRAQAAKVFDETMRTPGAAGTWSQTAEVPITGAFSRQALFADLLVLGQDDRADEGSGAVPVDFVESVLVASGRPGLVIPRIGWSAPVGRTVAIAWKETPESARAVSAALPFLQRAEQVHVLTWGAQEEPAVGGVRLNLQSWLRAHGVQATWHDGGPEPQALGELMLSAVCDLQADLLVMGCYGHGRAREWILGGTSRTILQSMTLPVLMAH